MKFSVIVPAYNAAQYIDSCIASVRQQKSRDWELILIDDGSTDETGHILDEYALTGPQIRVFHQENTGQFFARQRGIDQARGEWLLFLDSDDRLSPNCMGTLEAVICQNQADMVLFGGRILVDGKPTGQTIGIVEQEPCALPSVRLKEILLSSNDLNSLCLKAFRRELFEGDETDYSTLRKTCCGEDKIRILYPVTKAEHIFCIPEVLYDYYHHGGSVMHNVRLETVERMLATEMFHLLHQFVVRWDMDQSHYRQMVSAYYLRNYITTYYSVRRSLTDARERKQFRKFPWRERVDWRALRYARRAGMSLREKLKLVGMWIGI